MAKKSKEWHEGYAAVGTSLSRNPYLPGLKVEDPDDMQLTLANQKYMDWRDGWQAKFYGEDAETQQSDRA